MNLFFFIFFIILGIVGLIYNNEIGVFVGFGLFPWQIIRMKKGRTYNLMAIVISALAGGIFFIVNSNWKLLIVFIFIMLYNYWGHYSLNNSGDKNSD